MAKKKGSRVKRRKPGRPRALGEAKIRRDLIRHIEQGCSLTQAAQLCGTTYDTLNNTALADETFRRQVAAAKIKRKASLIKTVYREAKSNWKAAAWLLACDEARSFRPNRSVQTTNVENEVNLQVNVGVQVIEDAGWFGNNAHSHVTESLASPTAGHTLAGPDEAAGLRPALGQDVAGSDVLPEGARPRARSNAGRN